MTLPFENDTSVIIKRLAKRSMRANKRQNTFVAFAVFLTTFLIASVFSIGASLVLTAEVQQIRLAGNKAQAALSYPTENQVDQIKKMDNIQAVGTVAASGTASVESEAGNLTITLSYADETAWEAFVEPATTDLVGNYPQKENEIMLPVYVLEQMEIENPTLGMELSLPVSTDGDVTIHQEDFVLSGWYTGYTQFYNNNSVGVFASKAFLKKAQKSAEINGLAYISFKSDYDIEEQVTQLKRDIVLNDTQNVSVMTTYVTSGLSKTSGILICTLLIGFIMLVGYLLIYNILYISVAKDIRFYALLKTVGGSNKQIKRIILNEISRLCLYGIPCGLFSALVLSYLVVPFALSVSGIKTGIEVSFSIWIYLGAIFFAWLTARIGAMLPIKKLDSISPVEALHFTEANSSKHASHLLSHGKPLRMAYRNVFRNRKRAFIVFFSLFLGIGTFLSVMTLVSSMNVDYYANSIMPSDFVLKNTTTFGSEKTKQKFNTRFLQNIESISGLETIREKTMEQVKVVCQSDIFDKHIEKYLSDNSDMTKEQLEQNFIGLLCGIDTDELSSYTDRFDLESFERGEFALIATDDPTLYQKVQEVEFTSSSDNQIISIPIGGTVPFSMANSTQIYAPTLIVSNAFMRSHIDDPLIDTIFIDVDDGMDEQTLTALKGMIGQDYEIGLSSRIEARQELRDTKMILSVLGGGAAIILGFIGLLNFINITTVGILVRRSELSTLESIGMTKKQLYKMVAYEGLTYAGITLLLLTLPGSLLVYGLFYIFRQWVDYAVFTYPWLPFISIAIALLLICVTIPIYFFKQVTKGSLAERIKVTD